jgi:predicted transcriptional regulator
MSTEIRIFKTIELVCQECGKPYEAKSRKSRYCSGSCRQIAYNRRNFNYKDQQPDRDKLEKLQYSYNSLSQFKTQINKENYYLRKEKENLLKENSELKNQNEELYRKMDDLLNIYKEQKAKFGQPEVGGK